MPFRGIGTYYLVKRGVMRRKLIAALTVIAVLAACIVGYQLWQSHKTVTFENEDLGVSIETTQGSLKNNATIEIAEYESVEDLNLGTAPPLGSVVDITVKNGELSGDATLTFEIPDGYDPEAITVFTYDETLGLPIPIGGVLSDDQQEISVVTDHFSPWFLSTADEMFWTEQLDLTVPESDFVNSFFRSLAQVPPALSCTNYAVTVTFESTLPESVDVCAYYVKGELQLNLGNGLGAPLSITTGPGITLKKIEPESNSPFVNLAQFVRTASEDDTVVISGTQRATFVIDPAQIEAGSTQLGVSLNIGTAFLDFSGGLLNTLMPGIEGDVLTMTELSGKATQYINCLIGEAQSLQDMKVSGANRNEVEEAFIFSLNKCHGSIVYEISELLKDPSSALFRYGKYAVNQLDRHIVRRFNTFMEAIANSGSLLSQPIFTAIAAAEDETSFSLTMEFTDPPIDSLTDTLPLYFEQEDMEYRENPTAVFREPSESFASSFDYAGWQPTIGDGCLYGANIPWDQGLADQTLSGSGYSQLDAGSSQVLVRTATSWVAEDFRPTVTAYMNEMAAITPDCYGITHFTISESSQLVVTLASTSESGSAWVVYAYDEKGYFFTLEVITYDNQVASADIETAVVEAWSHWAVRLDASLGTRITG